MRPKKTAENSSAPLAQGFKPNLKSEQKEGKRTASLGRTGIGRPLRQNPDHFVKAELTHCEACGELIPTSLQQ